MLIYFAHVVESQPKENVQMSLYGTIFVFEISFFLLLIIIAQGKWSYQTVNERAQNAEEGLTVKE